MGRIMMHAITQRGYDLGVYTYLEEEKGELMRGIELLILLI